MSNHNAVKTKWRINCCCNIISSFIHSTSVFSVSLCVKLEIGFGLVAVLVAVRHVNYGKLISGGSVSAIEFSLGRMLASSIQLKGFSPYHRPSLPIYLISHEHTNPHHSFTIYVNRSNGVTAEKPVSTALVWWSILWKWNNLHFISC